MKISVEPIRDRYDRQRLLCLSWSHNFQTIDTMAYLISTVLLFGTISRELCCLFENLKAV